MSGLAQAAGDFGDMGGANLAAAADDGRALSLRNFGKDLFILNLNPNVDPVPTAIRSSEASTLLRVMSITVDTDLASFWCWAPGSNFHGFGQHFEFLHVFTLAHSSVLCDLVSTVLFENSFFPGPLASILRHFVHVCSISFQVAFLITCS